MKFYAKYRTHFGRIVWLWRIIIMYSLLQKSHGDWVRKMRWTTLSFGSYFQPTGTDFSWLQPVCSEYIYKGAGLFLGERERTENHHEKKMRWNDGTITPCDRLALTVLILIHGFYVITMYNIFNLVWIWCFQSQFYWDWIVNPNYIAQNCM